MDILDQILDAQKGSRDEKVENFKSLFAEEDNVAVKSALAKAKQVEEMEKLKSKHEQEVEALKTRHERENDRLKGAKDQETERDAIDKKREALRKANEEFGQTLSSLEDLEEGKYVSNIQDVINVVMKKINIQVGKEIAKNQEKGIGMLNTLGSFVGHKVTDKSQEKGKLFLKFGEELEERHSDVMRKRNQSQQKAHQKAMMKSAKKSIKDYDAKNKNKNEESEVEEGRNYKSEYENYHKDPEQIKRRAKRNEARRMLKNRKGIKGKDVHHKDNNPMNNDKSNLSIVSQKYNRTEPRLRTEKLWKDFIKGVKE